MNRLYKNLQDLLEQKIGLYENFIQLLNEEWKCVTEYSYDGLQEIIAKKMIKSYKYRRWKKAGRA